MFNISPYVFILYMSTRVQFPSMLYSWNGGIIPATDRIIRQRKVFCRYLSYYQVTV